LETVTGAMDRNDSSNPFFRNWVVSWARKLVIVKARNAVDAELAVSARRTRQRPSNAGLDTPQPVDWNLADFDKLELERALLAIDVLPRWALLLTVFERASISDAASLLNVEYDLLTFARTIGLRELACNIAREQGWIPFNSGAAPAMAMG
jgi:DNA-directed RNA polymerase specialized sigma24 family protein